MLLQNAHTRRLSNEILIRRLPVTCVCLKGVSGARRPGRWGICSVCSLFLTLSVSFYQPSEIKRKRLLNDTGWKGVREPLYIYGLCRTGGSGVVKWSHTPKPSLNSKYITDWGLRGNEETNEKKNPKRLSSTAINCFIILYVRNCYHRFFLTPQILKIKHFFLFRFSCFWIFMQIIVFFKLANISFVCLAANAIEKIISV